MLTSSTNITQELVPFAPMHFLPLFFSSFDSIVYYVALESVCAEKVRIIGAKFYLS
jgi:hypothetical protein